MAIRQTFNLKHFEQIAASMMNLMASVQAVITDYNIGSVNRTLLEAVAMELEEYYYRMFQGLLDGIPAGVYSDFGFGQLPATPAVGTVTLGRSSAAHADYTIPAGTVFTTSTGIRFVTTVDAVLLTGMTSVNVQVVAETAGAAGNVGAASIILFTSALIGIETVMNSVATSSGSDQETTDEQQVRFAAYITSLARSPLSGIEAGAKTAALTDPASGLITEQVAFAKVVEPYVTDPSAPVGIVNVYIDNGSGGASAALVALTQQVIDGYVNAAGITVMGYRAAGVVVHVIAVTLFSQDVNALVTLAPGATQAVVDLALRNAIAAVFTNITISAGLDWATLLSAMMVVTGVTTVRLTNPAANVAGQVGRRLRPGTITLTYQ